jgi:hypothetical protein
VNLKEYEEQEAKKKKILAEIEAKRNIAEQIAEVKVAKDLIKAKEETASAEERSEARKRATGFVPAGNEQNVAPSIVLAEIVSIEGNIVTVKIKWNGAIVVVANTIKVIEEYRDGKLFHNQERVKPEIGAIGELLLDGSNPLPIPVYLLLIR